MDAAYRIRPAVAADIEHVTVLDRAIKSLPHWRIADYLAALPPVGQMAGVAGTTRCFFVVEFELSVVGFAVARMTLLEADVLAELESVGVGKAVRRAGIGRALCEAVIAWAAGAGARQIELEVRSRSEGAIAMYRGLGFSAAGKRTKYYREPDDDAILMRLSLSSES